MRGGFGEELGEGRAAGDCFGWMQCCRSIEFSFVRHALDKVVEGKEAVVHVLARSRIESN